MVYIGRLGDPGTAPGRPLEKPEMTPNRVLASFWENRGNRRKSEEQADEEDVTFNVSSKSGQYHHSFETNIIFHNELENNIIQNKYPKVKFSEIHATVSRAWNGQYREKTGKKFSYRVSGQREDLANYFWLEKNECKVIPEQQDDKKKYSNFKPFFFIIEISQ